MTRILVAVNLFLWWPASAAAFLLPELRHRPRSRSATSIGGNNDDDSTSDTDMAQDSQQQDRQQHEWQTISQIARVETPWMTLIGERLLDPVLNHQMDYWRVEKDDSLVVVTLLGKDGDWVLPRPMYRPGVGRLTLDFPGGRVSRNSGETSLGEVAQKIVCRELGIAPRWIQSMTPVNNPRSEFSNSSHNIGGWIINSSFNSQKLWGYAAVLEHDTPMLEDGSVLRYDNVEALLADLDCLQCRHVLLEYLRTR